MNLEQSHEMVKDIINREVLVEHEREFKDMRKEEAEVLKKVQDKSQMIYDKLLEKLDEEGQKELRELVDSKEWENFYESEYYFERGVRCGLTTLSYIKNYVNFLY